MPAQMIYSMAQKAGVSKAKAEKYWDDAKKIAGKSGRDPDKTKKDEDYKYVVGIVKKMMGVKSEFSADHAINRMIEGGSAAEVLDLMLTHTCSDTDLDVNGVCKVCGYDW